MKRIDLELENRPRQEELGARQSVDGVFHRQVELVDGEHAAAVQAHERTALAHERVHDADTLAADTAGVATRHRTLPPSLDQCVSAEVGEDDHVETLAEVAGFDVGGPHRDRLETVHFKHPAGPTLVHVASPGAIEPDARVRYPSAAAATAAGLQCVVAHPRVFIAVASRPPIT